MLASLTSGPVTVARAHLEERELALTTELRELRERQSVLLRSTSSVKLRQTPAYPDSCRRVDEILDELEAIAFSLRHEYPLAIASAEAAAGGVAVLPELA